MEKPSKQMEQAILNSDIKSIQSLLEVLSVEALYNLIKNYGGCTICLPKFDSFVKRERNEKIKEDYYQKNLTINMLAKKYGLTSRHIQLIINNK